jgi:YHS domain-containing protein
MEKAMATDPVCGMEVDPEQAVATADYEGKTYFFCAEECKEKFEKDPGKYVPMKEEGLFKRLFKPR